MSIQRHSEFTAAMERIAGYSRKQLQDAITRTQIPIKKNIATAEMRLQMITYYTNWYSRTLRAEREKEIARVEKAAAEARDELIKARKELPKMRAARKVSAKAAKKVRAERKLSTQYFFTTYQMVLYDEANNIYSSAWYSTISSARVPDINDITKKVKAIIAREDAPKPYKRKLESIELVSLMNVPIKGKEQLKAFRAITDFTGDFAELRNRFSDAITRFKLDASLYRTLHRINGFPDAIDRGDGLCVKNFLSRDVGYTPENINKWFAKRNAIFDGFVDETDIKYTAQDIMDFAIEHNRSCYLLDRRNFCFTHHVGTSHHGAIYAMIEDGHVYPVVDEEARATIAAKMREQKGGFVPTDNKKEKAPTVVRSKRLVLESDIIAESELIPGTFIQTHKNDLTKIMNILVERGFIPDIRYVDGAISMVRFEKTTVLHKPEYDDCYETDFTSHSEIASHFYQKMVDENADVVGSIYGEVAGAKVFVNEPVSDKTHIGFDFSKFYYECAMRLEDDIPVFSAGSKQIASEFVSDGSYYYVITDDITLFRGCDYYTCELIELAVENNIAFEIDHKLVPHMMISPKVVQKYLGEIVEVFDGDLTRAKKSLVRFIGMLARSMKTTCSSYLIPVNEQDAGSVLYYLLDEKSRGRDVQVHQGVYPGVHMITSEKKNEIPVNCSSIHRAIINRSYIELFHTVSAIKERTGISPVGIKTDCLIYPRGIVCSQTDLCSVVSMPIKIESIKKCEVVKMELPECKRMDKREIIYRYENEFADMDEIKGEIIERLIRGEKVQVEGYAGTGKSWLLHGIAAALRELGYEVHIATSDWVSAVNIGGSTFHTLYKLGYNGAGWRNRVKQLKDRLKNTIILGDEISKLDHNLLSFNKWLSAHCHAMLLVGDCEHQCKPVEKSRISVQEALLEFIDAKYTLTVCKRGADILEPALKLFEGGNAKEIGYNMLKYKDIGDLCTQYIEGGFERVITKSNDVRMRVNNVIAEKLSAGKQTIDIKLITNATLKDTKEIDVPLFNGIKLVCIRNDKKLGLIKTDRVIITSIMPLMAYREPRNNETEMVRIFEFADELSGEQISKLFRGLFDLGFAITCYKSQSATYRFKHIIMGLNTMGEREKFVSTTRSSELKNIYIAESI